jgi:hypothetical protein
MKKINNKQKIKILTSYQKNPMVHPLTCGVDSHHQNLVPIEEDDEVILKCLDCEYVQSLDEEFIKLLNKLDKTYRDMIKEYKKIGKENKERKLN